MACTPPLQLALHVLPGADGKSMATKQQLLVVLRYAANPQAPGALLDVVMDLSLPPQVGGLVKVCALCLGLARAGGAWVGGLMRLLGAAVARAAAGAAVQEGGRRRRWLGLPSCLAWRPLSPARGPSAQVSPSGQWAKDRCQLRWELGRVMPGQQGLLRAVVSVRSGVAAAAALAAAQEQAQARVLFTGQRGRTLSGLGFEAGLEQEGGKGKGKAGEGAAGDGFVACGCQYFGEATVRC